MNTDSKYCTFLWTDWRPATAKLQAYGCFQKASAFIHSGDGAHTHTRLPGWEKVVTHLTDFCIASSVELWMGDYVSWYQATLQPYHQCISVPWYFHLVTTATALDVSFDVTWVLGVDDECFWASCSHVSFAVDSPGLKTPEMSCLRLTPEECPSTLDPSTRFALHGIWSTITDRQKIN